MVEAKSHPSNEELSGYSLQALEPAEMQAVETHLAACPECRQEIKGYTAIAGSLLFAVPPKAPPPELRSRLAASIASGRPVSPPARRGLRFSFFQAALGLATIVLLVTSALLAVQVRYLQQQQAALLEFLKNDQAALALISEPGVRILPLGTGPIKGNVVISPGGESGVLFLRGLSTLEADRTYQVWLIPSKGAPKSAGLFQVARDQSFVSFQIASPERITNFATIGITIEPRGGSNAPTTTPILLVNL